MSSTPLTVLITGCSSGIGYELITLFEKGSYRIIATALPGSVQELKERPVAQSSKVTVEALDVADYAAGTALIRKIEQEIGPVDILINNAGISYRSTVEDMTVEDEQRQIQVNYLGAMHLIRECLPSMRLKRSGRIINISSVGGMMAMPTMASYSASKFALEGASESLWYELKPWGIHVTLVRPGFINSLAFTKVLYSRRKAEGKSSEEYALHYENMKSFVEKIMKRTPCTSADVARRIFKLCQRKHPPLRAAGTPDATIFYCLRRILPRFIYHKLLFSTLPGVKHWGPANSEKKP
ncbi:SDR family oxidoreductase [Pelagicoccus sp. SDUM812002]|uniref:SDR family NAD(P)-dependent oxidoreductase n=1 Tax=Pelagicoccus sp. SDUM812002 TaxID=3041266 RepID=UPI00280F0C71|nr:SDR family oxidoreductase [Pelagicoccus sp. SDUM812002]MDQ8183989.1 SDR family oxidoreductase [Pelagicoccus sp. SDUM812002]